MADLVIHADHEHVDVGPARFVLSSGIRNLLFGGIALGVLCIILSFFANGDDATHARFWSNWLHNSVFFLGVGFMSLFMLAAGVLMYSGWHTVFKRVWEAYAEFLPVALLLLVPIVLGVWFDWHHIYHWADASAVAEDELLKGKSAFLNAYWYTGAALLIGAVWYFVFAVRMRNTSIEEDTKGDRDFVQHRRNRGTAGIFLPIAAFSSAFVIWQLVMSVDAHWYSTLYAWYATASWLVATIGLTIILLIFLKSLGYFGQVTAEHLHDLGKYLFAFSIFWTYLWFSQFMLIWYGNVGEETVYYQTRMSEFPILFWANLVLNFILPFFILMPNITKRKYGPLAFVAIMVVFGHWLDYFQMLKPGIMETAVHAMHGGDEDHESSDNAASVTGDFHTGTSTTEAEEPSALAGTESMTGMDGEQDDAFLTREAADGVADIADGVADDPLMPDSAQGVLAQAGHSGAHDIGENHAEDRGTVRHTAAEHDGMADHDPSDHTRGSGTVAVTAGMEHGVTTDAGAEHAAVGGHGGEHGEELHMAGFTIPGLIEIGTFIGFMSLFFFVSLNALAKADLVPYNDPYIEESLHHHV